MAAQTLDGKATAEAVRRDLAAEVSTLREQYEVQPCLAAVLVGDDPASQVYVRNKRQGCEAVGIRSVLHRLPAATELPRLLDLIDRLNEDRSVHGILVQLPLPRGLDEAAVIERIDPIKDVDGFHPVNLGLLAAGRPRLVACTPLGIRVLLRRAGIETRGRRIVILGRSITVGRPLALLLSQKGPDGDATVTLAHTATVDPAALCREADVVIAAAGQPELVRCDWIRPGAVVVDVGIHRRGDGSLCGDVHAPSVSQVAGWLSPVPGGVGPMTVAMLLHNTLQAARLQIGLLQGNESRPGS
ncbi:MAG: bifunctional protein FolD [Isosphaeraceae bacterium]|nr:MAG: bifunctional protein FolD [Isosphaeraceae bacterium]